jgi:outer membrane lipoprotein SlyB
VLRNPPERKARNRWKKLAFWDGVGALKGAWEFGKLGFVLGGGAGAFVVGATGAIFEGASASAAAYLEDRVESFFGL